MSQIRLDYAPRPWFVDFHKRNQRWAALVYHRRAGKTVAAVRDLIEKATYNPRPNPRYAYIAPLYNQAKQIAWTYLKEFAAPIQAKASESGLFVELALQNTPRITLYGADNPDSFRGLYFDGVVLDEYGNIRPSVWSEVLLPALTDRRGWGVFMGTPNGPNHFRDLWYRAIKQQDKWFTAMYKASQTKIIPEEDLRELRSLMTEEEYEQEMECSFEASTRGAYFAKEYARAREEKRITKLIPDESPLHFVLDLGYRDDTALWAWQERPDGYALLRAVAANTRPVAFYAALIETICEQLECPRGQVWLPHDAKAKTLATHRSVVEQFVECGITPKIVPNLDLQDGIQAARHVFPYCWFDEQGTEEGLLALQSYHREYDEDKKSFRDRPQHDWSSHFSDSFRYFALVCKKLVKKADRDMTGEGPAMYRFTLDELFAGQKATRMRVR